MTIASLSNGTCARFLQSAHFILGFSHAPGTHSFRQTGEYPDFNPSLLFQRRAYTSFRPRKSDINNSTFSVFVLPLETAKKGKASETHSDTFFPLHIHHNPSCVFHHTPHAPLQQSALLQEHVRHAYMKNKIRRGLFHHRIFSRSTWVYLVAFKTNGSTPISKRFQLFYSHPNVLVPN